MANEDKRERGPGSVEVKSIWGGFLYRATGSAKVKNTNGALGMRGYTVKPKPPLSIASKSWDQNKLEAWIWERAYWQPLVDATAWGFNFDQALARCKAKLCEAVNEDIKRSEARENAAKEKKDRTRYFENPCDPDPNVTNSTRT